MSQLTREQIECFRTALRNWTSRDGVKVQGRWEALCDMALSSLAQPAQPAPDAGEVERAFAWLNSQGDWGAREATSTIHALQRTNEQQAATIAGLRTTLSMRGKSTLAELPTFLALQAERDALRGQVAELKASYEREYAQCAENNRYAETQVKRAEAAESALAKVREELAAKQAKIDALMLEYCPDEMSKEQLAEWGRHQVPVAVPELDALTNGRKG